MSNSENGNSRWILSVSKRDLASDVAIRTIQIRLKSVHFYLPLAAHDAEQDIEHVHQLRVATRRAVAAIRLYREFLPNRSRRELCNELKLIRRAAGNARDCDVLIERQRRDADAGHVRAILKQLRKRRREAQAPLRQVYRSSVKHRTLKKMERSSLEEARRHSTHGKPPRFGRWARRQLRRSAHAFFAAEPNHLDDLEALHQFRLRGKDLRYAIELLAAAFPLELRTELYPRVEQLQERLGAINDHAVAIERFRKWRRESSKSRQRKRLKKLIRSEEELLAQALWDFARWWTPRRSKWIQRRFHDLVKA